MRTVSSNRRWVSGLIAFTVILVAASSGLSWQCLDGTPCTMHDPILQGGVSLRSDNVALHGGCTRCAGISAGADRPSGRHVAAQRCVIGDRIAPGATLTQALAFHAPLLAILPIPGAECAPVTVRLAASAFPETIHAPPLLLAHSGRAPPALL